MGYTHYYSISENITPRAWESFTAFVRTALAIETKRGIQIRGWNGSGEPVINEKEVRFNGDESKGFAYETFVVRRIEEESQFCKTNRQPYDTLVVACILAGKKYKVISCWSSDGDKEELAEGKNLYNEVLDAIQ